MSYNRKIARNKLKNGIGSNKIRKAWRRSQINRYGLKQYIAMRIFKTPQNQREEVTYQLCNGL